MKITVASLPGVLILEPKVFSDDRGFFFESYNKRLLKGLVSQRNSCRTTTPNPPGMF